MNRSNMRLSYHFLHRQPCRAILLQHFHDALRLEITSHRFIRTGENDAVHAVKFFELDRRRGVDGNKADDRRFDLRRRSEVISGNVDNIIDFGVQLPNSSPTISLKRSKIDDAFLPGRWRTTLTTAKCLVVPPDAAQTRAGT